MRILAIRGRNLASLYGDFELSLDRGPIAEAGIFSIAGPTGAGKSTLIDALCLALYGDTPRFDERGKGVRPGREDQDDADLVDANDRRNLLSRGTGEGHAEVDFECVDGRTWRARWEVRRARGKADGRFQNVQMTLRALEGPEVYSGVADVKRRIAERLGYSFAEFRRAVVLPQFEFRAFLDADPDARAQILERVTGTEIYARLSRRAHEQATTARAARDAVLQRAGDLQPLPAVERAALEARTAALLAARETAGTGAKAAEADVRWLEAEQVLAGELASAEETLAAAGAHAQAAEPRRALLAEVEAAEPLRSIRTDAERAAVRVAEAEAARAAAARAAESAAALRAQRSAAHDAAGARLSATLAETERLRPELEQARALDVQVQGARSSAKAAADRLEAARADRQGAADALAGVERRIVEARAQHAAAAEWLAQRAPEQPLAADWPRWKALVLDHASIDRDLAAATASAVTWRAALAKRALDREALQARASEHRRTSDDAGERLRAALAHAGAEDLGALAARVRSTGDRVVLAQGLVEAARQARVAAADRDVAAKEAAAARDALGALAAEERDLADRVRLGEGRLAGAEEALARLQAALGLEQRRAELREGEPCPLCGATEHPYAHGAPGESAVALQKAAVKDEKAAQVALRADAQRVAARIAAEAQRETHATQAVERQQRALAEVEERFAAARAALADADLPAVASAALEATEACAARAAADAGAAQAAQAAALKRAAAVERARADAEKERAALEQTERALSATALELEREGGLLREAVEKARGLELRRGGLETELAPVLSFRSGWREESRAAAASLVRALEAIAAAHAERRRTVEETAAVLASLQVERESTRARREERDAAVAAAEGAAGSARQAADALERQRAELLGGRPVEGVEGERAEAERAARSAVETTAALLSRAEQELAATRAGADAADRTAAAAAEAASVAAAAQADALATRALDRTRLDALLARGPEWTAGERRALAALDEARKAAEVTRAERLRKLDAHRATARPAVGLEEARARAADAAAGRERAEAEHGASVVELRRDDERRAEHAALGDELTRVEAEATRWGALAALIGSHDGRALRVFAQGLTLDALLGAANQHLTMLAPRYRLERVPRRDLDLQVVDGDLGNEVRGVNGLSGGESFLVSLALALGLASISTRRAQARTLFIDEGFGTLDRDTLEHAVAAIDLLRSGNRTVGVISHVPELHERIGVRVTVERVSAGRSRLVVPAAAADGDARDARRAS